MEGYCEKVVGSDTRVGQLQKSMDARSAQRPRPVLTREVVRFRVESFPGGVSSDWHVPGMASGAEEERNCVRYQGDGEGVGRATGDRYRCRRGSTHQFEPRPLRHLHHKHDCSSGGGHCRWALDGETGTVPPGSPFSDGPGHASDPIPSAPRPSRQSTPDSQWPSGPGADGDLTGRGRLPFSSEGSEWPPGAFCDQIDWGARPTRGVFSNQTRSADLRMGSSQRLMISGLFLGCIVLTSLTSVVAITVPIDSRKRPAPRLQKL
jgi:hypothetical protein